MSKVGRVRQETHNPFLNFYELEAIHRDGSANPYYMASRARDVSELKLTTGKSRADGVILFGLWGEKKDRVVLIRQYRYPLGDFVYELPAGLVEPGEDPVKAGVREMFEETGLAFQPKDGGCFSRPFYSTVGMTDEANATLFGYCSGTPTSSNQESSEEIQVILADREQCRRILREEHVAIQCAYLLLHFLSCQGDPLSFLDEE